ncbi:PKD domain-containing protein [Amycolatopsis sp. NPDC059021]|uniref:PKD domain-containing protein n=1 Tax=Amycolatopsis sp. NPDC059021 TaxID=3346704 RepID=UPI00366C9A99
MAHRLLHRFTSARLRLVAGALGVTTLLAGFVIVGSDRPSPAPQLRLRGGTVWVASDQVGQLTLLDGASAEAAAGVPVAAPGSSLQAAQEDATGYALDRSHGTVVRVDGATLEPSPPKPPVATAGRQLTLMPGPRAVYTLDADRELLTTIDSRTLAPRDPPRPLAARVAPDEPAVDRQGRLWLLDHRTGDLIWFADGTRHTRPRAATPDGSRLVLTGDRPAVLDPARHTAELLDPETGAVLQTIPVDTPSGDTLAVAGSPHTPRLLISAPGQLLVCAFGTGSCAPPIPLGAASPDLGAAVETDEHAVVPDYATGRAWIVDLTDQRTIERRLFDHPLRFDLLTRDGKVFYNDPGTEHAGVLELDGRVRPISKYAPPNPGRNTAQNADVGNTPGQSPPVGPPNPVPTGPPDNVPPVVGPGGTEKPPGPLSDTTVAIEVGPRDHGLVGEDFRFTVVPHGAASIADAQWGFGDETGGARGITVHHRWNRPGTYSVGVTATLSTGRQVHAAARITIDSPDAPPRVAQILMAPEKPHVDERVSFSADLTGGRPHAWAWTITGDRGIETTSDAPQFQYTFPTTGTYTVTLKVTSPAGSDQKSRTVQVAPRMHEARCGDVITTDTILKHDLNCADDVALTIAASDLTLDLGGYTITSENPRKATKGILVKASRKLANITVKNGTVTRFSTGIEATNVDRASILNMAVTSPQESQYDEFNGLSSSQAHDLLIRNTTVNTYGPFDFEDESTVTIEDSNLTGYGSWKPANCGKKSLCTIHGGTIHTRYIECSSQITDSADSSVTIEYANEVKIEQYGLGCLTATAKDNTNTQHIGLIAATNSTIINNSFLRSLVMVIEGSVRISGNTFTESPGNAIHIRYGDLVQLTENSFTRTGGSGVVANADESFSRGVVNISHNVFTSNGFNPTSSFPGRDGLEIWKGGTAHITVSYNHTQGNARYGINAEDDTVEHSEGNVSRDDPMGCRGVKCD